MSNLTQEFLSLVERNLRNEGFEVSKDIQVDHILLQFEGRKKGFRLREATNITTLVAVVKVEENISLDDAVMVSSILMRHAFARAKSLLPRPLGGAVFAVNLMVSEVFDATLLDAAQRTNTKKHWASMEFPVLYSVKTKAICFFKQTYLGIIYRKELETLAQRLVSAENGPAP
jgi:hypothetical protein